MKVQELLEAFDEKAHKETIAKEAQAEKDYLESLFGGKYQQAHSAYNGGEAEGKKYDAKLNSLGFNETDKAQGRPAPALGPRLDLRTKWKRLKTFKGSSHVNTTFYQLKDSDETIIIGSSNSGGIAMRTLYWVK